MTLQTSDLTGVFRSDLISATKCPLQFITGNLFILMSVELSDDVEDALYEESSGRQIQLQNVSLVITYTGMVVGAIMMAGFLYLALNFSGRRAGYGYGG